jgi:adenosylhomocysteine nucleosidase
MTAIECDLLLFVATPTEYDELKRASTEIGLEWRKQASTIGEFWSLGALGGYRVVVVRTEMGAIGPTGSTRQAHFYLAATEAQGIVCLGMAFGISRVHQDVGTVLVSDSLFPYDVRDVIADPDRGDGWVYRYDPEAPSYAATTYPAKADLRDGLRRYAATATLSHTVQFGCLLTGSARIRSPAYRNELIGRCANVAPNIVGGEMEGLGLLSLAERDRSHWIVVKGICDYADEQQIGDARTNRRLACANASRFVLGALRSWHPSASGV